jgi:hypothetical protein
VNAKTRCRYGWTPLREASDRGHVHVIKEFLDHGADIEATTGLDASAFACSQDHLAVVVELLGHAVDIDANDNNFCNY